MRSLWLALRRSIYRNRLGLAVTALIVAGLVVLLANRIFIIIQSGNVGVLYSPLSGTDTKHDYPEGMHILPPWDKMFIYNVQLQQREDTIVMYANDGLELHIRLSTQFHVPRDEAARIQETVGPEYVQKVVHPDIVSAVRSIIGNYTEGDVYARDEAGLLQDLRRAATSQSVGVHYDAVKIMQLMLPDSIERAIQYKIAQQQLAQTQGYRILTAEGEAKRKAAEAEGYAAWSRITGMSVLQLREIEAAENISRSPNSKLILYGAETNQIPLMLNGKPTLP